MLDTTPLESRPDSGSTGVTPSARGPVSARRRLVSVAAAVLFTVVWAVVCTAAIDRLQAANDAGRPLEHPIAVTSVVFALSALLVWVALLSLVALTGRVLLSAGILVVACLALGFADLQKLQMRSEPVYPSDLQFLAQPSFLVNMVGAGAVVLVIVGLVVCLGLFLLAGRLVRRVFPRIRRSAEPRAWAVWTGARVAVFVVAALLLVHAANFNDPGNKVKQAYAAAGAQWVSWNQRVNYERNGFVAGLLYNTRGPTMRPPADYSQETMAALATKWSAVAEQINRGRSPGALDEVTVVVVLSESFSDPTRVSGIELAEDPLPFTRRLMSRTESGEMLSQLIGGGTANMEFETLTGFSLAEFLPQLNTPYSQLVGQSPTFPSVVGYLRRMGHDAVAIHPAKPAMYNREEVYSTLGFSRFVYDETMQSRQQIERNNYLSDDAAFTEVEHQIAEAEDPLFVNLVTMQNHYPMEGKYADPIGVTGETRGLVGELDQYARGLRYSDTAMRDFLRRLESSPEKTAVVFYGDHAPPFWPRSAIYQRNEQTLRKTPFFLWTNFERLPHRDLPVTSPTHFMPLLFDALDAPLPPYYALLQHLHQEVPAMSTGEYHYPDGEIVGPQELTDEARAILHDYRLVQYDLTTGKRYSQATMFYPEDD